MPRPRIIRTQEEELIYQENLRLRRQTSQRRRREAERLERSRIIDNNRNLDQDTIEDYLGQMNVQCEHCQALHFSDEKVPKKGF